MFSVPVLPLAGGASPCDVFCVVSCCRSVPVCCAVFLPSFSPSFLPSSFLPSSLGGSTFGLGLFTIGSQVVDNNYTIHTYLATTLKRL